MKFNLFDKRTSDRRRGQGMLEFALAVPVFLLLLLGIIEFGRMFLMYTSVFAAAREGARYGAAVETLCDPNGLQAASRRAGFFAGNMDVAIQYDDGYGNLLACEDTVLGDRVNVTASIDFESITGVIPDLTLHSTARRTIIKRVFLEWTLQPTSANAGAIPPTATFGPPPNTATPTNTPDPDATSTRTPTITQTPTITFTPEPPECESGSWTVGMTTTTEIYDLSIENKTPYVNTLTQVSISWSTSGERNLLHIEFQPVGGTFATKWTGPDSDGYLLWYPDPVLQLNPGISYLRFVFQKKNVEISDITLNISYPNGYNCQLNYP